MTNYRFYKGSSGFTLIELMIVVIIIGVLAAIAMPMMQAMKVKAICSEAVANMGMIRDALRRYKVINDVYPDLPYTGWVTTFPNIMADPDGLGISVNNLQGLYWEKNVTISQAGQVIFGFTQGFIGVTMVTRLIPRHVPVT